VDHLKPFVPRKVLRLPNAEANGWKLKRYGILAEDTLFNPIIASSALDKAIERLPVAGNLVNCSATVRITVVHST
jgi:hypothetical protein